MVLFTRQEEFYDDGKTSRGEKIEGAGGVRVRFPHVLDECYRFSSTELSNTA